MYVGLKNTLVILGFVDTWFLSTALILSTLLTLFYVSIALLTLSLFLSPLSLLLHTSLISDSMLSLCFKLIFFSIQGFIIIILLASALNRRCCLISWSLENSCFSGLGSLLKLAKNLQFILSINDFAFSTRSGFSFANLETQVIGSTSITTFSLFYCSLGCFSFSYYLYYLR